MISARRVALVCLLFFVLIFSFLYFVFPNVLFPLRIDDVPSNAYIVPWMRPSPQITELSSRFDIDSVMANALKINMTFNIAFPNDTRVIPSTVYLGHDSDYLYVGGRFVGMSYNPTSTDNETSPQYFGVYFDVPNSGVLTSPESGSRLALFIQKSLTGGLSWIYHDLLWINDTITAHRMIWIDADVYYMFNPNGAQPAFSLASERMQYDATTGTVSILFARYLSRPENSNMNALQMRAAERWVMGFQLELGFTANYPRLGDLHPDFVDGWPRNKYPYLSNDSSWWPKMVIDLTNPPATYPGSTASASPSSQQQETSVESPLASSWDVPDGLLDRVCGTS